MRYLNILILLVLISAFKHPHYLSVADLKYNTKEKQIQGFVKIFAHDFERELKFIHKKPVDLINPADTSHTRKLLENYLQQHFKLKVNGGELRYAIIGFELEQESVYMYLESRGCEMPSRIEIDNRILYGSFKQQNNIIHMEVNGRRQSRKLTHPESVAVFSY